ncbi:hypothetical protein WI99_16475 [Burkholderia cepacia]|nr:hypothetical protein WI99_16475 [Burkholderia cepacia]
MIPLYDRYPPGIAMHVPLVVTDHLSFVIEDRRSHCDDAFAEIFERHLLPDLGIRLAHCTLEIHTPHDLVDARLIAKYHIVRVAARWIVLIRGIAMLEQFSGVSSRDIGFVVCSTAAAFRDRRFRRRCSDRRG